MPEISYKVKGDSNPQGKPKVYFCCHQDDFERYFTEISDEIMKKQNCVFYYDSNPSGEMNEKEWLSYLGEMQLFVMPVTTRLLTTENKALNFEFRFAEEKHIPVLPLIQESGLDELFALKVGSLQYLNKYQEDATAISYEEKLGKYLSSVLVGDELAAKVRAAFDAYIFLSYRKKDRVYAQELMRLIHKNKFCRDIAIWYDEFLIPGEDFNNTIEAAIKKSDLFALAVTPNLVNEENYVMTVEFPMARDSGKKILPAEIVATDKVELKKKYEGIPDCTDAHNEGELSENLLSTLKGIALMENDSDPQHNFFIGLAYLSGIDVEVNHERAVELITSSAESGLIEAMEKLVAMYRNGEGVARNYETAIDWQERLVKVFEDKWEQIKTEKNASELCLKLWVLGGYWEELYKYGNAFSAYSRMQAICEEALRFFKDQSAALRVLYGRSCNSIGEIYQAKGKLYEAEKMYLKALEISENIAETKGRARNICKLSADYGKVGEIYYAQGKLSEAKEMFMKSLEISYAAAEKTDDIGEKRNLSVSYYELGDIYQSEDKLSEAEEMYLKAAEIYEDIAERIGTVEAKESLPSIYGKLGDIYQKKGKPSQAKGMHLKALEISQEIVDETGNFRIKNDLSTSMDRIGSIYRAEGRIAEAKEMYMKSLEIRKTLVDDVGTVWAKRGLSVSYEQMGEINKEEGKLSEAKEMYMKSLEIRENMADKISSAESQNDLAVSYYLIANLDESDIDKDYMMRAFNIWRLLSEKYTDNSMFAQYRDIALKHLNALEKKKMNSDESVDYEPGIDLYLRYEKLGDAYKSEGNLSEAEKMYLKSLRISAAIAKETGTVPARSDFAVGCNKLGDVYQAEGMLEKAKEMYTKALGISLVIVNETGTATALRDFSVSCNKLGDICFAEGNHSEAEEMYLKSAEVRQIISEKTGTAMARRDLSVCYEKLVNLYSTGNKLSEAEKMCMKLLEIREAIAREESTVMSYDDLAIAYYKLALLYEPEVDKKYMQQAYNIWQKLGENYPDNLEFARRRDIAKQYL